MTCFWTQYKKGDKLKTNNCIDNGGLTFNFRNRYQKMCMQSSWSVFCLSMANKSRQTSLSKTKYLSLYSKAKMQMILTLIRNSSRINVGQVYSICEGKFAPSFPYLAVRLLRFLPQHCSAGRYRHLLLKTEYCLQRTTNILRSSEIFDFNVIFISTQQTFVIKAYILNN